jgi:spermidine/putrescine transport system permease protein
MKLKKLIETNRKNTAFFFGAASFAWQILFFYTPIIFILCFSVTRTDIFSGITFTHYASFMNLVYAKVIVQSLFLGLFTALVCLLVGYPLTYWIVYKTGRLKIIFLFFLLSPFFTNFLLHVYAWFFVLDRGGILNTFLLTIGLINEPLHLLNTLGATLVMMIYYYLPFMVLPIYSILDRFDKRLLEASLDLGASWWQTCRRILLPMTWPGVQLGFLLVYVPACTEFAIPDLMGGGKYMFMGSVVSFFMLGAETLALGTAFTVVSCIVVIISSLVLVRMLRYILL